MCSLRFTFANQIIITIADVMAPTNIKLYYFNIRGRAEVLRWVLAQAGAQFEDMRLQGESWQAMKSSRLSANLIS